MRLTNPQGYNLKDQTYFPKFQNKSYPGHKKNSSASWNLDGTLLVTGDSTLRLWSFDENYGIQLASQNRGRDAQINQIKFYTNNTLASINRDSFKLWDVRDIVKPIKNEKKSKPDIVAFAWNYDTNTPHFALLSKDNSINVYDIRNMSNLGQSLYSIDKNKNDITEIEYDHSGSVLFCAGSDGSSSSSANSALIMYSNTLELICELLTPHNTRINSIAVDPTHQYFATCSDDSLAAIYTLPDMICQRTYSHTDCSLKKASFSCKGQYLAVSCQQPKLEQNSSKGQEAKVIVQEPCIDFYNVKTGGHAHRIKCGNIQQILQWHPKKNILAYFDLNQDDSKKPGNEKEERYLHIYGI